LKLGVRSGDVVTGGVALAARVIALAWAHDRFPPAADGFYYHTIATRLAGGFGSTWLWPDGAVTYAAHYPIGYPALLALPYRVLGLRQRWQVRSTRCWARPLRSPCTGSRFSARALDGRLLEGSRSRSIRVSSCTRPLS